MASTLSMHPQSQTKLPLSFPLPTCTMCAPAVPYHYFNCAFIRTGLYYYAVIIGRLRERRREVGRETDRKMEGELETQRVRGGGGHEGTVNSGEEWGRRE